MLYKCYLRNGIVYVPTVAKLGATYIDIEPVAVLPVANIEGVRRAFLGAVARENIDASPPKDKWPAPVVLKYAGVKTWSAFARNASTWSIKETNGRYEIVGYRTHRNGYWAEDPNQKIEFPPGTKVDEVVERMMVILRDAARKK